MLHCSRCIIFQSYSTADLQHASTLPCKRRASPPVSRVCSLVPPVQPTTAAAQLHVKNIMRRALCAGLRQYPRSLPTRSLFTPSSWPFRKPPPSPRFARRRLYAATALTPGALVLLGERRNSQDGKTGEEQMLQASREEINSQVPGFVSHSNAIRHSVYYYVDTYIWEPVCTGLRFLHLAVIFVPVIATVPIIWIGRRDPKRDHERYGTLWWYGFLVTSMERGGPAFIKVALRQSVAL